MFRLLSLAVALSADEKKAIHAPKWTQNDAAEETDLLKSSYQNLDHVQDELIDAAKRELAETKKLPTLAEATHVWHMGDDFKPDAKQSSFAETAEKKPGNIGVDFSNLDSYRSKLDSIHQAMNGDIQKLKAQTAKDEQFAEQTAALAKQADAGLAPRPAAHAMLEQRAEETPFQKALRAVVAHELANHKIGRQELQHAENLKATENAMANVQASRKVDKAQHTLEALEKVMEAKREEMGGHETPEAKYAREKIENLLKLSHEARAVMDAVKHGDGSALGSAEHLAMIQRVKQQIEQVKGKVHDHMVDHLNLMHQAVNHHMSLVQQADPTTEVGGESYSKIADNLSSLQSRIKGQIAALKATEAKDSEEQVDQLNNVPTSRSIEVDSLGNMRIDK